MNWSLREAMRLGAAVVAISFVAHVAIATDSPQPGWVADPKSGCRVWNPNPEENEAITWSGGCRNGVAEGHGVLQWFHNKRPTTRYEGELRDGKADGRGLLTKREGIRYDGEWQDFKANGLGHFVAPHYEYIGVWSGGCARDGEKRIGVGRDASTCP
jgi:hypothetical protein